MPKTKKKDHLDFQNMTPQEQLKFEIAQELGLGDQVIEKGPSSRKKVFGLQPS